MFTGILSKIKYLLWLLNVVSMNYYYTHFDHCLMLHVHNNVKISSLIKFFVGAYQEINYFSMQYKYIFYVLIRK